MMGIRRCGGVTWGVVAWGTVLTAGMMVMAFVGYGQEGRVVGAPHWVAGKYLLAAEQAGNRVVLIDPAKGGEGEGSRTPAPAPAASASASANAVVWEWSGMTDTTVPADRRKWFSLPSEIKASADKKTIFFTCSGGAIGAVDVESRRLCWYTFSGSNPHSIEPLPDGNVATASSNGNFVKVYFTAGHRGYIDSTAFNKVTLTTAHNVIWDDHDSLLWSAGLTEIAGWGYGNGRLREVFRLPLPGRDGHDLVRYNDSTLLLSTGADLWLFHIQTRAFSRYEGCGLYKGIKSISFPGGKDDLTGGKDGLTGGKNGLSGGKGDLSGGMDDLRVGKGGPHRGTIVVYPNESWWSDRVYNCDGSVFYRMAGARFYKVRFW